MMSAASLDQALASSTQIRNSKASQESNAILLDAKIKLTPIATVTSISSFVDQEPMLAVENSFANSI